MSTNTQQRTTYPRRVLANDPRRIDLENDWGEQSAIAIERNGNLTLVAFADGHEEWLAPHELRRAA